MSRAQIEMVGVCQQDRHAEIVGEVASADATEGKLGLMMAGVKEEPA